MPEFNFKGRNKSHQLVTGKRFADSETQLAGQLIKEGITPIDISEFQERTDPLQVYLKKLMHPKIKSEELLMFCRQMHTLNKSGIPILQGVLRCAETSRNKYFSKILMGVIERLNSGQNLATSMEHFPEAFPMIVINLVRVGEQSGNLDEAFSQAHQYLDLEATTKRRVKSAVRYPTFVISAILVAILVINTFVIPAFAQLFAQFKADFPWPTRLLIGISNFITGYWYILLLSVVVIYFLIRGYLSTEKGRMNWHRRQLKLPIIGSILERIYLSRFARTFAVVIRAGLPLNDGLKLVSLSMGNVFIAKQIDSINEGIARGESLTQAATNSQVFSSLTIQMLATGEETGNLDEMCNDIAEFYEGEVDFELQRLSQTIEPVLIIGIGAMVLILALAVFLPMWDVIRLARNR